MTLRGITGDSFVETGRDLVWTKKNFEAITEWCFEYLKRVEKHFGRHCCGFTEGEREVPYS